MEGIDRSKIPVDISLTCHEWLTHAIPEVRAAMEHAWRKHGEPTHDPVRGATNLMEEVGEVAKEALDATRTLQPNSYPKAIELHQKWADEARVRMHKELMQVAGYAILLAIQLQGRKKESR